MGTEGIGMGVNGILRVMMSLIYLPKGNAQLNCESKHYDIGLRFRILLTRHINPELKISRYLLPFNPRVSEMCAFTLK